MITASDVQRTKIDKKQQMNRRGIANRLFEVRSNYGLTLRDVSAACGVHISVISRIENGGLPDLHTALKLSRFYEQSVNSMWWFSEEVAN